MGISEWVSVGALAVSVVALLIAASTRVEMRRRFQIELGVRLRVVLRPTGTPTAEAPLPDRLLVIQNLAGGTAHGVTVLFGLADGWSMQVGIDRLEGHGEWSTPLADPSGRHSAHELMSLLLARGEEEPRVSASWTTAGASRGTQGSVPVVLY